jgi:hypothetical protein
MEIDWEFEEYDFEDLEEGSDDIEEYECSCSLCFCLNKSTVPGVCGDCSSGAHQG